VNKASLEEHAVLLVMQQIRTPAPDKQPSLQGKKKIDSMAHLRTRSSRIHIGETRSDYGHYKILTAGAVGAVEGVTRVKNCLSFICCREHQIIEVQVT
jgi:hypothetical protein